jgi:drug/metabolite transporter (DMT)-like permease
VNETAPTLVGAAVRFTFAGTVLFAWATSRTGERPARPQWKAAAIVGVFLLLGGNALVAVSENMGTPTGVVALIIALIPLWLALFDRVLLRSGPLGWKVVAGLIGGFVGAAVLVGTSAVIGHVRLSGMLVAVCATLCWTVGSRTRAARRSPGHPCSAAGCSRWSAGS